MKVPITLAIDRLVAEHLAPYLKARGFRKKGQRFWRGADRCTRPVELGRGKFNEGKEG